jgi:hypothetical protein
MTLLFDGTIRAGMTRNGLGSGATFGPYDAWGCLPRTDSFQLVQTNRGTTLQVTANPGDACGSNTNDEHILVAKTVSLSPNEWWMGWSNMLDSSWQGQQDWEHFGLLMEDVNIVASALWNSGLYMEIEGNGTSITVTNNLHYNEYVAMNPLQKGQWNDWMWHVVWSTGSSGLLELYQNGQLVYSKYGRATLNPGNSNQAYMVRLGMYRGNQSRTTQIFYTQGVKIATTRAEVEYGGTTPPPPPPSVWHCVIPLNGNEIDQYGTTRPNLLLCSPPLPNGNPPPTPPVQFGFGTGAIIVLSGVAAKIVYDQLTKGKK